MGDQIEFPNNYGRYMQLSMAALEQGNYSEATVHLKKAYQQRDENSLNILLVSSLYHNGEIEEALEYALEKQSFYETNEKRLLLFAELLICSDQFLLARKYIDEQIKKSVIYESNWFQLDEQLTKRQVQKEQERLKYEKQLVKELFSLAALPYDEQFKRVDEAANLKTENLEKAAPSVFQNPYVHPLARAGYLALLVERQIEKEFDYSWFGEHKQVTPADCFKFDADPLINLIVEKVDSYYLQNPSLRELLLNELMTILLNLYPFTSEIINEEDVDDWIQTVTIMLNGNEQSTEDIAESKREQIMEWIEKVHQQLQ